MGVIVAEQISKMVLAVGCTAFREGCTNQITKDAMKSICDMRTSEV